MWPSLFQRLQEIRALRASEQLVVPGRNDGDTGDAPPPDSGRHVVVPRRAPQSGLTPTLPRPQILEATPAINCSTREPSGENGEEGFARDDAALPAPVAPTGAVNPSAVDGYIDGDVSNIKPPAAVTNAIAAFPEVPGLVLKPPTEKETSYIYKWGVRVEVVEGGVPVRHWICLADDTCRRNGTNFTLSCDRTSKPANHLAVAHRVVSVRTKAQLGEKRKREDEIQHLRSSSLFRTNPRRFALLMETLRIINNNLPFRFGEYRESRIVEALLKKEDVQIIINAAKVTRAIIELYSSTRIEIMSVLGDSKLGSFGNFVIMSDFWTCKITHRKYMGVRVYFVDSNWEFRSILLGVRRFSPSYGDRETGIQGPYKAWTLQLLGDFGLTPSDFFGATSDSGPDVKNLLKRVLKLKWEWCMAHMAHAATKEACGMNGDAQKSRNPGMTELIARIKKTIFDVQSIEKTGDLFAALCRTQTSTSTTQLLSYAANRFLSITGSIRRILEKWGALVDWYDERAHLARRQRISPPSFRLKNHRRDLEQILSLLEPISRLKRHCQAERPNQVEVLMELYQIRLDTLNLAEPLLDYRSKPDSLKWIAVDDLTELAAQTRQLLRSAFDSRFFCRYTSEDYLDEGAFVFEMQQRLHPEFKNPEKSLNAVVKLLYKEQEMSDDATTVFVNSVNEAVKTRLRALMGKLVVPAGSSMVRHQQSIDADSVPISGIRARFGSRATQRPLPIQPDRVSQELRNWEIDQTEMRANESVLDFWMRMEHSSDYNILPRVVKVLFALPSSSAQIERDFSVCGEMVTSQRASLSNENVDMCAFLNRNEEFVDIAQCESIPDDELDGHIPQCVSYVMEATPRDDEDEMILDLFSQASVEEDDAAT